ncbi:hypothetical protein HBH74_088460 [Parastagonospora nodorum]|nr:hypothetical protein HBH74_088460 [Parastagonospora nodorum]KAH4970879.1 hypothetical protein HBH73_054540 [Parastagonospora nodorum]KAH4987702.1 hypothetical protein HBI76_099420 [Parastagonospora nodorum]KAH5121205.1 hypothetical protein HBH71_054160 [Parastagonospora nodorum]KAH6419452.1 hypothetical protein HBI14_089790 [Parastagonospora nodorum]
MADTDAQDSKTTEKPKQFTVTIPSLDGSLEVVAHLQDDEENPAHPPKLINLSKTPPSAPTSSSTTKVPKTHIILSTGSGHRKAETFFQKVVSPILDLIHPGGVKACELHTTTSETSILELARDVFLPAARQGEAQRIVLASGDGGVVDLVNGLSSVTAEAAPEIVLLPLGTANALYHSINAGRENDWGLKGLGFRKSKPLPTFTATFSPGSRLLVDEARKEEVLPQGNVLHGAVVVSWGMHASLVADSDTSEFRKFGIDRFKMAAKEALYPDDGSLPHAYKGQVSVLTPSGDWEHLPDDKHLYTLATLVSNLEAPFCISPDSKPLDGSMHLVYFGPTSGDEAMRIMGLAYQGGKHVHDEMVRYQAIEGLKIKFAEEEGKWRRVCVDGKIVRVEEGGWVEVRVRKDGGGVGIVVVE